MFCITVSPRETEEKGATVVSSTVRFAKVDSSTAMSTVTEV